MPQTHVIETLNNMMIKKRFQLREKKTSMLETFVTVITLQEKVTTILSVSDTANVSILCPPYYKNISAVWFSQCVQKSSCKFSRRSTEYQSLKWPRHIANHYLSLCAGQLSPTKLSFIEILKLAEPLYLEKHATP